MKCIPFHFIKENFPKKKENLFHKDGKMKRKKRKRVIDWNMEQVSDEIEN